MVKIDRLPSGSYRARVSIGNGKYKSFTGKVKKDVQLQAAQYEMDHREQNQNSGMTVNRAMRKYVDIKSEVLSPSTISGYERIIRTSFPEIRNMPLSKLTNEVLQSAINSESANHSAKTVQNDWGLLSSALKMLYPELRPNISLPRKAEQEIIIPEEVEVKTVMANIVGTEVEIPFLLGACAGMRMSEILGLSWNNVDFDKKIIRIYKSRVKDKNGQLIEKDLMKTNKSRREICMFDVICKAMEAVPEEKRIGHITELTAAQIYKRVQKEFAKCGFPKYSFHSLRHYFVSVCVRLGIPKDYIADLVGHEGTNMIDKVYKHIMGSAKSEFEDRIQQFYDQSVTKSVTA